MRLCGSTGPFLNLQWLKTGVFFVARHHRTELGCWKCSSRSMRFCCVTILSICIYDLSFSVSAENSYILIGRLGCVIPKAFLWLIAPSQVSQFQRPKTRAITCLCENVKVLQRPAITRFLPTPWQLQSSRSPRRPVPTCHALLFLQVSLGDRDWFLTNVIYGLTRPT